MKKLPKTISISLSPSKLFLNDLELIEEIYKDNCQSYKINTSDYEIDCIEEIKQLGVIKFNFIQISSYNPSITLTISSDFTRIYSFTNNIVSIGIVTKLQELIESRRSPLIYSTSTWSFAISGFILILSYLNFQEFIKTNKVVYEYLIPILEISLLIVQAFFLRFGFAKFPVLYLEERVEKKNFLLEHKNQIMLLLIGGVITLTGQILLQWIKNIYFK